MTRLLISLFLLPVVLSAQPVSNPALHQSLLEGIDLAGKQRYKEAAKLFDRCIALAPDHPAGYLNKAVLYEVMSLDFETPVPQDFLIMLDKAKERAEAMREKNGASWEALYHLGTVHSYIAYYKFRDGKNWISGLSYGFSASSLLQDCIELNPKAYDAFTGLGTYLYWKSKRMSFLTWTPFVSDDRHEGIRMLLEAEKYASYSQSQAMNSLVWIWIEEEEHADAEACARRMLKKYPGNRLFLWGLASAAEHQKKWKEAREAYQEIVRSVDNEVTEPRYILLQARAKIALMSYELKDYQTARQEADWVLAHANVDHSIFTGDGSDRINRRVNEVKKMMEKLN